MIGAIQVESLAEVMLAISALLAIASVLAVVTARLKIPLTLILVVVGFTAGELARANGVELPIEGETFHDVLLFVFLPALVFEAGLVMPVRVFARNLVPILTLAIIALSISAVLVGLLVHFGLGISLTAALLFGALISATDPVAVTQTFRELGVPSRLLVLVEGESLFNDGIAIVLFNILLVAALGTEDVGVLSGAADFAYVFIGGAAMGGIMGLATAEVASRLGREASTALTIAVAYGAFALGEEIFGFSGVMASVSAALVLAAFSRTLIPTEVAETWHSVWGAIAFVANALLFVLIGVVIEADMITENLPEIGVAVGAVIISRPLAIFPVMRPVTKLAGIPAVGIRNEMVLVWGGLRGGVALALALAIPEELPAQETFIAMTAGVVVATLILNATTIRLLVQSLGLDRPDDLERFVAAAARFDGAAAAREHLHSTLEDREVESRLTEVERAAADEIVTLDLDRDELYQALLRRGLAVERASLQELVDEGLVPQWHGRVALGNLEDQLDELAMGRVTGRGLFETTRPERLIYEIARRIHMGRLTVDGWVDVAYRDLQARIKAAGDAVAAIRTLERCPGVHADPTDEVIKEFEGWRERAQENLRRLAAEAPRDALAAANRHYAADLARLTSRQELRHLAEMGLVSAVAVDHASELIIGHLEDCERDRISVSVDADEDLGD